LNLHFSIISVHGPPRPHFKPSWLLNFYFDADPDLAFAFDADPDPDFAFDVNPDPDFAFEADPDLQHTLTEVLNPLRTRNCSIKKIH
jgi:hypothetical protein